MEITFAPLPTALAAIISFLTGWLWFSPLLFGKKYQQIIGQSTLDGQKMLFGLVAQFFYHIVIATLLYALYPNTLLIVLLALASGLGITAGTFFQNRNPQVIPYIVGNDWLTIIVICGVYGVTRAMEYN